MSKRYIRAYTHAKPPRPETMNKTKHYRKVNYCPECGKGDNMNIVRLRYGFFYCRYCGTEFMLDEKL